MLQTVNKHGFDAVSQAVLKLLSDKVYESTNIARQRFPDLFEPSASQKAVETSEKAATTSQKAAKAAPEAEVATTEQAVVNGMHKAGPDENQNICKSQEYPVIVHVPSDSTASDTVGSSGSPGPFPVHLPFPTEHLLMEKLQKTLEFACYQYGMREFQSTMKKHNWDCPEAVELSRWTERLGQEGKLKQDGFSKPLKELLQSIARIRHTAVHRVRTDSSGLQRFLADAEDLARALGDDTYIKAISKIRSDTESVITELTETKKSLRLQLDEAQEEIAKRRAELDQQEQKNLRHMEREDEKYCALAGEKLQKALNLIGSFAVAPETGGVTLNGDGDTGTDDSNLDHAEHFEDCFES
ncbi:hypothetical protein FNAPI_8239 [Fusarium napiforme]|uniref:Ubiquinol-cytochrome-c reductase cytochrome c1 n=1 Tax=Fusarium napiforme TaxID=42672 RepID=A0A8H5J5C6_9HYPO|nr:hypothetical protein FNAPI_8239 [Fusarium napiforme]